MAELKKESRPVEHAGAQYWECPFCRRRNGVPEVSQCLCGAIAYHGTVTRLVEGRA